MFRVDQFGEIVSLRKYTPGSSLVLPNPATQIVGHADIQDTIGHVGKDVHPVIFHNLIVGSCMPLSTGRQYLEGCITR